MTRRIYHPHTPSTAHAHHGQPVHKPAHVGATGKGVQHSPGGSRFGAVFRHGPEQQRITSQRTLRGLPPRGKLAGVTPSKRRGRAGAGRSPADDSDWSDGGAGDEGDEGLDPGFVSALSGANDGGGNSRQRDSGGEQPQEHDAFPVPGSRHAYPLTIDDAWARRALQTGPGELLRCFCERLWAAVPALCQPGGAPPGVARQVLADKLVMLRLGPPEGLSSISLGIARALAIETRPPSAGVRGAEPTPRLQSHCAVMIPLVASWFVPRTPRQVKRAQAVLITLLRRLDRLTGTRI
jgi:hypothetical protein